MGLPGTLERMHELTRREAYPSWFSPVIPFEAAAVRIHGWALGAVPGLLQTEPYARSVIQGASGPRLKDAAIERTVAARMERQAILGRGQACRCCGTCCTRARCVTWSVTGRSWPGNSIS